MYSSLLFLILSVIAKYYNYRELAISLLILFITSIIFHSNINTYTRVVDKIAIITVYFTSIIYYKKCCSRKYMLKVCDIQKNYVCGFLSVILFLVICYLFIYGYYANKYCYNEDLDKANNYHSFLHLCATLCILLVIIM